MDELSLNFLFSIIVVLILLSAFFSSAETGMMSLNRYRLKHLHKQGHKGARRAWQLLKRPDQLISLILIGNNLVNFVTASLFTLVAIRLWGEEAAVFIAPVILTLVVLIFAEITPKTIAALNPEKIAFPAATVLTLLLKVLFPVVWLINSITNGLLKIVGIDPSINSSDALSSDELRTIVGEAGPHIPKRHQGMLINILDLEEVSVEDIMIPRNEIIGIDLQDSDEDIINELRNTEFTRLPVYNNDINNIIGILHQRNISRIINNDKIDREQLSIDSREPYFVPESTSLHTQLVNFQKLKQRMGVVVDEYGVVQGVVTLEDILEEIVGGFTSRLNDELEDISSHDDGYHSILATTTIREINKNLGWNLPTEGPKTLNGLLLEHLESFPDAATSIKFNHYVFEIMDIKDNRIQNVKARRLDKSHEHEDM